MKISFVIPAYNEESVIEKCLESIFRELSKKNIDAEIIVVDNASTDKTAEIVRHYKKIKLIYESRKGLSNARQAGYLAASGDLIANVDADTMLTPGWIEKVLEEFSKDSKLVALSGPFIYYDVSVFYRMLVRIFYLLSFGVYILNRYILRLTSLIQGGNYIIRKTALDKVGGYTLDYDLIGEDADIAKKLFPVGKVKFSFGLPIYSSGRRVLSQGIVRIGWKYTYNYFWVSFFGKPLSKKSPYIRADKNNKLKVHAYKESDK